LLTNVVNIPAFSCWFTSETTELIYTHFGAGLYINTYLYSFTEFPWRP